MADDAKLNIVLEMKSKLAAADRTMAKMRELTGATQRAGTVRPASGGTLMLLKGGALTAGIGGVVAGVWGLHKAMTALVRVGSDASRVSATFEDIQVDLEVLLGSTEAAVKRIQELQKFSASTPFQMEEIARASKILQTLSGDALSTGEGLKLVGDVAAVTSEPINEIAVHMGRLYSGLQSGRAVGESTARLQELGALSAPARSEIERLQKSGEKGEEVWRIAAASFERYAGTTEKRSQTFNGLTSTLSDNWSLLLHVLGQPINSTLKPFIRGSIALLEGLQNRVSSIVQYLQSSLSGKGAAVGQTMMALLGSQSPIVAAFNSIKWFFEQIKPYASMLEAELVPAVKALWEAFLELSLQFHNGSMEGFLSSSDQLKVSIQGLLGAVVELLRTVAAELPAVVQSLSPIVNEMGRLSGITSAGQWTAFLTLLRWMVQSWTAQVRGISLVSQWIGALYQRFSQLMVIAQAVWQNLSSQIWLQSAAGARQLASAIGRVQQLLSSLWQSAQRVSQSFLQWAQQIPVIGRLVQVIQQLAQYARQLWTQLDGSKWVQAGSGVGQLTSHINSLVKTIDSITTAASRAFGAIRKMLGAQGQVAHLKGAVVSHGKGLLGAAGGGGLTGAGTSIPSAPLGSLFGGGGSSFGGSGGGGGGSIPAMTEQLGGLQGMGQQVAQSLQGSLGGAIGQLTQQMMGLGGEGQSVGQTLMQIGNQLLNQLIQMGIQMAVNHLMGTTQRQAATAQTVAQQQTIAAAAAPAAAATSISTGGGAATLGMAAAAAAIAAIIGMIAAGGFATGGLIPGSPSARDNRIASVATGEFVTRSAAVSHYGSGIFNALNSMSIPRSSALEMINGISAPPRSGTIAFSRGGLVKPVSTTMEDGMKPVVHVVYIHNKQQLREYQQKVGNKESMNYMQRRKDTEV